MNKLAFCLKYMLNYIKVGLYGKQLKIDDIEITGNEKFVNQVQKSLLMIKEKAPEEFAVINNYVGEIRQSITSMMWRKLNPPRFDLTEKSAFYSVTWCAAIIAHDSYHSKLYQLGKSYDPNDFESLKKEELLCMEHQIGVMKKIGAPINEIKYAKSCDGTHPDVNKDGKYTWSDVIEGD